MNNWIGIDVSKLKLDLALLGQDGEHLDSVVIDNRPKALLGQLRKWKNRFSLTTEKCLICLEPTGRYSDEPVRTLVENGFNTWLAHPTDILKSIGNTRGKNDKIDALRIADYARRFEDKARLMTVEMLRINGLRQLISKRTQLVGRRKMLQIQIKEHNKLVIPELRKEFNRVDRSQITVLDKAIKKLEVFITQEIKANVELHRQYVLMLSVDSVGPVLASHLLAFTSGFLRFTTARQLACHAGVAPFEHSSGSSIRGKTKTSPQAQQKLKSVLHMSALGAIQLPGDLQDYWLRKTEAGKPKMAVLNAIRNKIIHRVYAVLERGTPFVKDYAELKQALAK